MQYGIERRISDKNTNLCDYKFILYIQALPLNTLKRLSKPHISEEQTQQEETGHFSSPTVLQKLGKN